MDKDGTKDGYDIPLTRAVAEAVDVPVIASGGAGELEHFYDVLTEGKADAVLAASVFHFGQFTVRQVKEYLRSRGVELKFDDKGLIPAIVQDSASGKVLMLAYMNQEALEKTLDSGVTWFYSRSRRSLWQKGETSGNVQKVREIRYDCDGDSLLVSVEQTGAACHEGTFSCFSRTLNGEKEGEQLFDPAKVYGSAATVLQELYHVIADRKANPQEGSYTTYLFTKGQDKS
ncbi:hypothetical protein Lal_00002541 [Lupinus albus]|nr:hypothetical protein Lal_00002541 [Lupinus albus]